MRPSTGSRTGASRSPPLLPLFLGLLAQPVGAVLKGLFSASQPELRLHQLAGPGLRSERAGGEDCPYECGRGLRHIARKRRTTGRTPGGHRVVLCGRGTGAAHGHPEPDRSERVHPVHHVLVEVLSDRLRPRRSSCCCGRIRWQTRWDWVGLGRRSPASCSNVNWS